MSMIRTAALATALLLTTTLAAQAATLTTGWTNPRIETMPTGGINEPTSPGDAFVPWNRGEKPERSGAGRAPETPAKTDIASGPTPPPDLTLFCSSSGLPDSVVIGNAGNTTILKGTKLSLVLANGETVTVTVPYDLGPDWSFHAGPFPGLTLIPCTAEVILPGSEEDVPK
jgi:hypothetical protein